MQEQSAAPAIEQGFPSESHWILPNGFGNIDLPPEEGGLPKEIGQAIHTPFPLRPGLEVYTYDSMLRSPVSISCEFLTDKPYLWLSHTFSGHSEYQQGHSINGVMSNDWSCCAILRDPVSDFVYAAEKHKIAGVLITPDRLRDMLQGQRVCRPIDDFLDGKFDPLVAGSRPTAALRSIADQICCHPYQGAMASVFLEAKAFEMLAESLRMLIDDDRPDNASWARQYALAARDIVMADLANPPRIEDVAKQVGLSQRRLNEVFREAFGASALQCLVQWRLDHARDLLAAGELTIKQVAHQAGYAHVSNFSLAFTRRFGHPPSGRAD